MLETLVLTTTDCIFPPLREENQEEHLVLALELVAAISLLAAFVSSSPHRDPLWPALLIALVVVALISLVLVATQGITGHFHDLQGRTYITQAFWSKV